MAETRERPTFEFHFHDKVGQNIANVERMEVHFDKDMQMQVLNAESINNLEPEAEQPGARRLCVALNARQRGLLEAAERHGLLTYNESREGYDPGPLASKSLVAYLCGCIFCGDYTDDEGLWVQGKRFDEASFCELLFGFDLAAFRRSARSRGIGKSPLGFEKIDEILKK